MQVVSIPVLVKNIEFYLNLDAIKNKELDHTALVAYVAQIANFKYSKVEEVHPMLIEKITDSKMITCGAILNRK